MQLKTSNSLETKNANKMDREGSNAMFLRLARMRIIQSSLSKSNATKRLLAAHKDERVLVFCGTTAVADNLGIPSYHNKSKEKQVFEDFAEDLPRRKCRVDPGRCSCCLPKRNEATSDDGRWRRKIRKRRCWLVILFKFGCERLNLLASYVGRPIPYAD